MVNYSNAVIYTIRTGDSVYVGSTCNFKNRKYHHKICIHNDSKNNHIYNCKLYKTIRENDCEWIMKPYKEFPCENKTQLEIEEERCRVELNADLNSKSCHNINRESPKEYAKQNYYKNRRQKITCECGCVVNYSSLSPHKTSNKHFRLLEEKQKFNTDA
jgi:hypothetical protein